MIINPAIIHVLFSISASHRNRARRTGNGHSSGRRPDTAPTRTQSARPIECKTARTATSAAVGDLGQSDRRATAAAPVHLATNTRVATERDLDHCRLDNGRWFLSLFPVFLLLSSCTLPSINHAGETKGAVQLLGSAVQCSPTSKTPEAVLIDNREQLQRMFSRLQGTIVTPSASSPPAVDFRHWKVIFISAGERPTAGYRLSLPEHPFVVRKDEGRLSLHLHAPQAGTVVAAVVTHPCLLVRIPAGDYTTIRILGLEKPLELPVKKHLPGKEPS